MINQKKIALFGPGPQFKGGIAHYNTSLAQAFARLTDAEVHIVSWTQQYPSFVPRDFIDRKSGKHRLGGQNIKVHYITNYNNPFTWHQTCRLIKRINPDILVLQWAIALQGLPIGYIARKIKQDTNIDVVFDLHFVDQKEGSSLDRFFTKIAIKHASRYIVHAYKTARELAALFPETKFNVSEKGLPENKNEKPVLKLYHPVYEMFEPDPRLNISEQKKELNLNKHVFLFFGFIRKYKGLHNAIEAFAKVLETRKDVSLLIVGESFWQTLDSNKFSTKAKKAIFGAAKSIFLNNKDDEGEYNPLALIKQFHIEKYVTCINEYVPNEEVHKYFQVSDSILLFYLTATPSGVESMAYNFNLPILATRVGHFPEIIVEGYNGYLAEPGDISSMAEVMLKSIEQPIRRENVAETAKSMSWGNYARKILSSSSEQGI